MVTILILIVIAFCAGFVAGVVNATSRKVDKARSIIDEIRK